MIAGRFGGVGLMRTGSFRNLLGAFLIAKTRMPSETISKPTTHRYLCSGSSPQFEGRAMPYIFLEMADILASRGCVTWGPADPNPPTHRVYFIESIGLWGREFYSNLSSDALVTHDSWKLQGQTDDWFQSQPIA